MLLLYHAPAADTAMCPAVLGMCMRGGWSAVVCVCVEHVCVCVLCIAAGVQQAHGDDVVGHSS